MAVELRRASPALTGAVVALTFAARQGVSCWRVIVAVVLWGGLVLGSGPGDPRGDSS